MRCKKTVEDSKTNAKTTSMVGMTSTTNTARMSTAKMITRSKKTRFQECKSAPPPTITDNIRWKTSSKSFKSNSKTSRSSPVSNPHGPSSTLSHVAGNKNL